MTVDVQDSNGACLYQAQVVGSWTPDQKRSVSETTLTFEAMAQNLLSIDIRNDAGERIGSPDEAILLWTRGGKMLFLIRYRDRWFDVQARPAVVKGETCPNLT